ncbi:MAG: hypothetical protein NC211_07610 [Alistipes senegalensis]|nr:hypothetical protein [Oxalobacter formigenes]MCM1281675.1 hypothetical protein [Alistipes senegalensis]
MSRAIAFLFVCLLFSGCASRIPTQEIHASFSSGRISDLREAMEESHASLGEFATALNLARLLQVEGRWADSIRRYDEALAMLEEYESRAIINAREIMATAGTILLSRGAKTYYGTGYERSLLHTLNSLNYVMLGDFTGAAVEMRRMDKRQEFWLQESQSRIEENLKAAGGKEVELPVQYSMRELLKDESVRSLVNSYQEPFSYTLGAILFRLAGDEQAAAVSARRAAALDDRASGLFRGAWPPDVSGKKKRLKKTDESEHTGLPMLPAAPSNMTEVTVVSTGGLAPSLQVEQVRVLMPHIGYFLLDLPSYARALPGAMPEAAVLTGDPLVFYPLLHTDRLAYRTLQDEIGFEMGSAISRAAVRAGISAAVYAGAHSSEDTRDYAELAGALTTLLLDLWTTAMSDAARNWEMLPNEGYIAMGQVPAGSTIVAGAGKERQSLTLPKDIRGVIIMLTCFTGSRMRMDYVTY